MAEDIDDVIVRVADDLLSPRAALAVRAGVAARRKGASDEEAEQAASEALRHNQEESERG